MCCVIYGLALSLIDFRYGWDRFVNMVRVGTVCSSREILLLLFLFNRGMQKRSKRAVIHLGGWNRNSAGGDGGEPSRRHPINGDKFGVIDNFELNV